jgi:hypothetical protein
MIESSEAIEGRTPVIVAAAMPAAAASSQCRTWSVMGALSVGVKKPARGGLDIGRSAPAWWSQVQTKTCGRAAEEVALATANRTDVALNVVVTPLDVHVAEYVPDGFGDGVSPPVRTPGPVALFMS